MRVKWVASLVTASLAVSLSAAQQPVPAQPPIRSTSPLRIAIDLVQVDAVVTDARGRHVSDLTAADFEILQDGKPQTLSAFTYVRSATPAAVRDPPEARPATVGPVGPATPVAPDKVRRTIAIVVDDLGLSFESTFRVREVLKRFIERDVQPGDLVAILRTGGGMGALQQFTTDRRMLTAAAERLRWNFMTRASAFDAAGAKGDNKVEALRNEYFTAGTLGAIQYVIRGVAELPGRKSIVLLSEGFRLQDQDEGYGRVFSAFRTLVDAANRAGIVIYTIDPRGLAVTAARADDRLDEGATAESLEEARRNELRNAHDALGALADETGGLFMRNTNDIAGAVRRALDDQQGYYLLGYVPHTSTFSEGRSRFHSLRVRVKRPGLQVRSRRGFIGRPDGDPKPRTAENRMIAAVTSPFAGGGMSLRLSSFFAQVEKLGPVLYSFMHVNARDLTFTKQPDGKHVAEVETLAVTFGDNGQVADQHGRRYTITLVDDGYQRALERGFVYTTRLPVKRPGPYQLRIALRDVTSDRIGSASHFVDVPDVKKGRLTLSSLMIQGSDSQPLVPDADNAVDDRDPGSTVALRTFRQNSEASYLVAVYNARRGPKGEPQLQSEVRLYRDGVEVFRGQPRPVEPTKGQGEVLTGGTLRFREAFPPGSYILELAVIDRLAKKNARATQTIDFDVVAADEDK